MYISTFPYSSSSSSYIIAIFQLPFPFSYLAQSSLHPDVVSYQPLTCPRARARKQTPTIYNTVNSIVIVRQNYHLNHQTHQLYPKTPKPGVHKSSPRSIQTPFSSLSTLKGLVPIGFDPHQIQALILLFVLFHCRFQWFRTLVPNYIKCCAIPRREDA